jgi:hypothetical protein
MGEREAESNIDREMHDLADETIRRNWVAALYMLYAALTQVLLL